MYEIPTISVLQGIMRTWPCHEGLLGMACTNSEAIMVPTFGRKAMLGSNPIAVAMPADPYPFFFDCSTTVVTRGKLEMYNKMGKPLPDGWALDKNGHASNNAPDVLANIVAKKRRRNHASRRKRGSQRKP